MTNLTMKELNEKYATEKPKECKHEWRKIHGSKHIYCILCGEDYTEPVESRDEIFNSVDIVSELRWEGKEKIEKQIADLERRIDEQGADIIALSTLSDWLHKEVLSLRKKLTKKK